MKQVTPTQALQEKRYII